MSLASETRDAVRARPFLYDALATGVVNYAAVARELDVEGDTEAITAALRRFGEELAEPVGDTREATVRMKTGLGEVETDGEAGTDGILWVGGHGYAAGEGGLTGILATGGIDSGALEVALGVLRTHDIGVEAAGVAGEALLVVVSRRDGPDAVRMIEGVLS